MYANNKNFSCLRQEKFFGWHQDSNTVPFELKPAMLSTTPQLLLAEEEKNLNIYNSLYNRPLYVNKSECEDY